jgi:DNA-binding NtrC family response regulator
MAKHVLVIEDDEAYGRLVRRMLEGAGFAVTTAKDFATAMPIIESTAPLDVLVTDVNLLIDTPHGLSIGMMAKSKRPRLGIVFITGAYDPAKFALYAPDFRVVRKPFTAQEIVDAINQSLGED